MQETANLVTFTEEILNGKLQFSIQCYEAKITFLKVLQSDAKRLDPFFQTVERV